MKSIKTKIISVAIILVLIPILITGTYMFLNIKDSMLENSVDNINFYMDNIENEVNIVMNTLENIAFTLLSNQDISNAMTYWNSVDLNQVDKAREAIEDSIKYNFAWDSKVLNSVFIFRNDTQFISELRQNNFDQTYRRNADIYKNYQHYRSFNKLISADLSGDYAYYVLDIFNEVSFDKVGKLVIEVIPDKLFDTLTIRNMYHNAEIILTSDQSVIYSTTDTPYVEISDSISSIDGKEYYHYRSNSIESDLAIDVLIPQEAIYKGYNDAIRLFIIITALTIVVMAVICYMFYKQLVSPLNKIESSMDILKSGDFSVRLEPSEYIEFNKVYSVFNDMVDNMGYLFAEVYEKGRELSKIELIMLQSQINPHFIFNVLEAINMKAMDNNDISLCNMIQNLAKLIRSNILLKDQEKITIKQEIDYVNYYLSLQKERFSFDYNISYEDDNIVNCFIPKLIIQPLVENSVVHGFSQSDITGKINVNIWREDNNIFIKVSDNGVGFDNSNKMNDTEKHNNLALENIKRRLELLYSDNFDFEIKSKISEGTRIVISIPISEEDINV